MVILTLWEFIIFNKNNMYIWMKDWKVLVTSVNEIDRDDLTIVERDEFSDYEKSLLYNWALADDEWNLLVTDKITAKIKAKQDKEDVLAIASLDEQINLTAWVLDVVVDTIAGDYPSILTNEWVIASKAKLAEIKEIIS